MLTLTRTVCGARLAQPQHGRLAEVSLLFAMFLSLLSLPSTMAAIVGTNTPAQPVTLERIAQLPKTERKRWEKYLKESVAKRRADQVYFQRELKASRLPQAIQPPEARGVQGIPLDQPSEWYGSSNAVRIANNLVSFQTPAGGWSKNVDMTSGPRKRGERFAHGNLSHFPGSVDFDVPADENWNYIGTFDNDATTTQLHFLARVITAKGLANSTRYHEAFFKGLNYIFSAQYPNGGWPQVWPLQGGCHDAITYNDDAMTHVLELLRFIASGNENFGFVPRSIRRKAAESLSRGVECVLASQIRVKNQKTVWCQQHDPLTLAPCSARNYEMPSQASAESAGLVLFLMDLPHPKPAVVSAIDAAVSWFQKTEIYGMVYRRGAAELESAPGGGPLWARYTEIGVDRPIFGDRDKTIHERLDEISAERRRGYGWYRDTPREVLERYDKWKRSLDER
jgi:PelA/Pel-15E family pectate lyase